MFRAQLISPPNNACDDLRNLLGDHGGVLLQRHFKQYLNPNTLLQQLQSASPEILFLSAVDLESCLAALQVIEEHIPSLHVMAFGPTPTGETLRQLMQAGVREYLHPLNQVVLSKALERVSRQLLKAVPHSTSSDHLYTFLPAKPGSGASTIALHVTAALANQMGHPTLLMDCDLSAGALQWLLKLDNTHALPEAVARAAELDDQLWPQLVARRGNLDLLAAGAINPSLHLDASALRQLITFARRRYDFLCADLSGNLERYSVDLMAESKKIFLVTTPELSAVYLAGERLRYLQQMDLADRVYLLLNRTSSEDLVITEQIEQLLGLPVLDCIPNSYEVINRAASEGEPVQSNSPLGRQFLSLAHAITDTPQPAPVDSTRPWWQISLSKPAAAPRHLLGKAKPILPNKKHLPSTF